MLTLIRRFFFGTKDKDIKHFDPRAENDYLRKYNDKLKSDLELLKLKYHEK
jgi:hypothetical protein